MKRLLLSIILALGFHAVILSTDMSWLALAPDPTLTSKSLSIRLSADSRRKPPAEADAQPMRPIPPKPDSARNKMGEKPPQKNPALIKPDRQLNDSLPAAPQETIVQKTRLKKALKALTRINQAIKPVETVHSASVAERHFLLETEAKTYGQLDAGHPLSTDTALIKKTHSVPIGSLEPLTTAARQATETKEVLSESVNVSIARPLYKQNTSPRYPQRARRMGYEGLVMLKVLVDENGRVDDLEVLKSSGYAVLDRAAITSVKTWLFEPGTEAGKKKKMWVKIPVRFQLE